jgi:hypothetical protein
VLRGVITGRGDVHADLVRPDAVDDLLQALADEAPANPPTAWTSLKVRTTPPRDPADAQAAEGLLADLATVVNDAMADPDAWADGPLEAAATVRATPVDPDDEPWDLRVDDDLIARAAALAAAQLERDPS